MEPLFFLVNIEEIFLTNSIQLAGPVKITKLIFSKIFSAFMDIFPIIVVITFFQLAIIQKPFLQLNQTLFGVLLVVLGLFIFILGLESALFPIGEKMADEFAIKGNEL